MFEREIKFIYDFNLNKVKQLGAQITFPGLAAAQLHPAILQYISAEIEYLIYEDRQNLLRNSSFDYSGDEIGRYFQLINDEIKKEKKLSFDYVDQLVLQAASFTVNYLVQPSWSLTKLIFDKEDIIPVSTARQIINYVHYYEYVRTIIEKYFRKKNIVNINKNEFESLLKKIDTEVFAQYSEKLLDKVLNNMSDFFNIGGIHKTKIPLSALELFLKEKGKQDYIQRLSDAFYPEPKYAYEVSEIRKVLYSPVPMKKDRYIDRVVKQDVPKTIFTAPVEPEESTPVPAASIAEPAPVVETKTTIEIIDDSDKIQEELAGGPSAPEILEEDTEQPVDGKLSQQGTAPDDQTIEIQTDAFQQFQPEEIQSHNPTEVQLQQINNDKEDPGNLDLSRDNNEDERIDFVLPSPERDHAASDKSQEFVDPQLEDYKEVIEENTSPGDDDTILIETSDNKTIEFEIPAEPPAVKPEDNSLPPVDEETHGNIRIIVTDNTPDSGDQDEDYIEEPLTPWKVRTERKDISSFLSGKDMNRIITNVFNDDTEDFALTFERIADCKTEGQAETILDRVLKSNAVKPTSKDALLLRKIINEYFNQ